MRTRKQREDWWNNLSLKKQDEYIKKICTSQAEQRKQWSIETMKHRKPADCKKCIHGVTHSCTDDLPRGCEYFYKVA